MPGTYKKSPSDYDLEIDYFLGNNTYTGATKQNEYLYTKDMESASDVDKYWLRCMCPLGYWMNGSQCEDCPDGCDICKESKGATVTATA